MYAGVSSTNFTKSIKLEDNGGSTTIDLNSGSGNIDINGYMHSNIVTTDSYIDATGDLTCGGTFGVNSAGSVNNHIIWGASLVVNCLDIQLNGICSGPSFSLDECSWLT